MITKNFELPPMEELTVQEVNLGTSSLLAGSFHLGKYCLNQNDEYMLCKDEEKDPRKCLDEGKAVTACSLEFFRKIKKSCLQEFEAYANCIDKSSMELSLTPCRNTQGVFDKCVLENLQIERPDYGYFCRPRVHDTKRPKPEGYISPEFPDRAQEPIPDDRKASKYGLRKFFYN